MSTHLSWSSNPNNTFNFSCDNYVECVICILLCFKALNNTRNPQVMIKKVGWVEPRAISYGERAFSSIALRLWNKLPPNLKPTTKLDKFQIKTSENIPIWKSFQVYEILVICDHSSIDCDVAVIILWPFTETMTRLYVIVWCVWMLCVFLPDMRCIYFLYIIVIILYKQWDVASGSFGKFTLSPMLASPAQPLVRLSRFLPVIMNKILFSQTVGSSSLQ